MSAQISIKAGAAVGYIEETPDESLTQNTGFDSAALITMAMVVILFHVLAPDLRDTQIGQSLKNISLRRVVNVVVGLLSLALFVGERGPQDIRKKSSNQALRIVAGGILAVYTLYVASYVFFGLELLTDTFIPAIAEFAALFSAVLLWQPWRRIRLYRRITPLLLPAVLIFLSVIVIWDVVVKAFNIEQLFLPAPSVIATTFASVYPRLVSQGWTTFQNALWGFAIGCSAGVAFGLISARFVAFSKALLPYAIAANSIPIIAFAPIMNQWFGLVSPWSKISVVAVLSFFPAMVNTVRGLTSASPSSIELMRSYAASEWEVFRKVRFPTALPYIFSALKVAATASMIGAIVSEYFGGPTTGLGVHIKDDAQLNKFPLVWSEIIVASILGIMFFFVVSLVEKLVMPWHFRGETE